MSVQPLCGELNVPSDKSISHRSVLFPSIAEGVSLVHASVLGRDNLATIRIVRQLGVTVRGELNADVMKLAEEEGLSGFTLSKDEYCHIEVHGKGWQGLTAPVDELDCGNSGTSARLLTGFLAGTNFSATLTGDDSLRTRPFRRVTEPIARMGGSFNAEMLPLTVTGSALTGIHYDSPKASAQVKSAVLLAGLRADGPVSLTEPRPTRDHTERMLSAMGCAVETKAGPDGSSTVSLPENANERVLQAIEIEVPGDFSAAAFFLVAASIVPGSAVRISHVGYNETRIGLLHVLKRMGASIEVQDKRVVGGEDVVDFVITAASLRGIEVTGEDVVLAIDEIPILAIAACFAEGETRIRGAEELRVKESDRLAMTARVLKSFGQEVEETEDGLIIQGNPDSFSSFEATQAGDKGDNSAEAWRSSGDHRIAMCGAVLEYALSGRLHLSDTAAVETSFPTFAQSFQALIS